MDEDRNDHVMWLLQEVVDIVDRIDGHQNHFSILLGIIATLCQHVPDMETAKKTRGDMDAMIGGSIFLSNYHDNGATH